jgi:hypothetical protein
VKLDSVGDGKAMPAKRNVVVVADGLKTAGVKRRRERCRDLPLERISCDIAQLTADSVETLSLALADLDGQQLQKMPVSIGRAGSGALGPVK